MPLESVRVRKEVTQYDRRSRNRRFGTYVAEPILGKGGDGHGDGRSRWLVSETGPSVLHTESLLWILPMQLLLRDHVL
jgi:hypothetical protein